MPDGSAPQKTIPFFPLFSLVLLTTIVYLNSFQGAFLFDDIPWIVNNPKIQSLHWPWSFLENERRPLLHLTMALNFAAGGLKTFGYHLFNLLVHLVGGLSLFSIIRRCCQRSPRVDLRNDSIRIAFVCALFWLIHPLQTQSVTYIIQRAESMCGMFYLLTVLASIRYFELKKPVWLFASVGAMLLGGLTKEVIITVPAVILLVDRAFFSGSFKDAFCRHKMLYALLFIPVVMMIVLFLTMRTEMIPTAGFGIRSFSPFQYAITQPGVILHYLKLVVWLHPLLIDHPWRILEGVHESWPTLLPVLVLLSASIWSLARYPRLGTAALSFFIILAPSSSFIPLRDPLFEHRMYLALACAIILLVLGVRELLRHIFSQGERRKEIVVLLSVIVFAALSFQTYARNRDYSSKLAMWQDAVEKYPDSCRAQNNLGKALSDESRFAEAFPHYKRSLELCPDYPHANNNMGVMLFQAGQPQGALKHYRHAIKIYPIYASAYNNIAVVFITQKRFDEAEPFLRKALELQPRYPKALNNLGVVLLERKEYDEAGQCFRTALELDPGFPEAQRNMTKIIKETVE